MSEKILREKCEDISIVLSSLNSPGMVYNFLRDILSEQEIIEISRRFKVAQMLEEKVPYKQIEELTGMSSTTIARISKYLNGKYQGYKSAIKYLQSDIHHTNHIHSG